MKSQDAQAKIDSIDIAIQDIKSFSNLTSIEESYLAKFLIVFICGIFEEVIETLINEYVLRSSNPQVAQYVKARVDQQFRNPDSSKLMELLNGFDKLWSSRIRGLPQMNRDGLDSIVNNKNLIAHGRPCAITLGDVYKYYNDALVVMIEVDQIL